MTKKKMSSFPSLRARALSDSLSGRITAPALSSDKTGFLSVSTGGNTFNTAVEDILDASADYTPSVGLTRRMKRCVSQRKRLSDMPKRIVSAAAVEGSAQSADAFVRMLGDISDMVNQLDRHDPLDDAQMRRVNEIYVATET